MHPKILPYFLNTVRAKKILCKYKVPDKLLSEFQHSYYSSSHFDDTFSFRGKTPLIDIPKEENEKKLQVCLLCVVG